MLECERHSAGAGEGSLTLHLIAAHIPGPALVLFEDRFPMPWWKWILAVLVTLFCFAVANGVVAMSKNKHHRPTKRHKDNPGDPPWISPFGGND